MKNLYPIMKKDDFIINPFYEKERKNPLIIQNTITTSKINLISIRERVLMAPKKLNFL